MKRETKELGMETHPRKGVLIEEVSKHQEKKVKERDVDIITNKTHKEVLKRHYFIRIVFPPKF